MKVNQLFVAEVRTYGEKEEAKVQSYAPTARNPNRKKASSLVAITSKFAGMCAGDFRNYGRAGEILGNMNSGGC
jgi:hypothetical protein